MNLPKATLTRQEMLWMFLNGHSYREIGASADITGTRVHQLLTPPPEVRSRVKGRADRRCQNCGLKVQHGHIHQVGSNGVDEFDDIAALRYLCISCHRDSHGIGQESAQ